MIAYDNHPKVTCISAHRYEVSVGGDVYEVTARRSESDWVSYPAFGSGVFSGLRTREETEAALDAAMRGPFPSAEAAIADVLGSDR